MAVDERRLRDLIVESEDLQVDALRDAKEGLRDIVEVRHERLRNGVDPEEAARFDTERRKVLRNGGLGLGAWGARGLFAGGLGAALTGILSSPAAADTDTDIMILQTAGSLETLAVATYKAALGLPFIKDGNKTVVAFAETTMKQHGEHNDAFGAMAKKLGGKAQTEPNAKYAKVVADAKLTDAAAVVELATALEQVATQTYNANLALLEDKETKALMASVMGVESQHLAVLRAVGALLAGGAPELIAVPTQLAKLPAAAGSVSFPEPFEGTEKASPPEEGAVK
jgi:rubrerythrin